MTLFVTIFVTNPPMGFQWWCIGTIVFLTISIAWYENRDSIPFPHLPQWIAIRTPQYQKRVRMNDLDSHLCPPCRDTIHQSHLLTGTCMAFTPSIERYEFDSIQRSDFEISGSSCSLCTTLRSSMKQHCIGPSTSNTPRESRELSSYVTITGASLPGIPLLRLKIWQPDDREGDTYLQLHSSDEYISYAFKVQEVNKSRRKSHLALINHAANPCSSIEGLASYYEIPLDQHWK